MSGIAHAAVRSLAGPSIKRSYYYKAAAAAAGSKSDFSSSWRRRPSITSTAAFSFSSSSSDDDSPSTPTPPPSSPDKNNNHRQRALSLYRQLLRGAERMPTPNRQNYIKRKTRDEFRKHKSLTDQEEIEFQLRLADTNLDTVLVQAEHLSRLFGDPEYQNYN